MTINIVIHGPTEFFEMVSCLKAHKENQHKEEVAKTMRLELEKLIKRQVFVWHDVFPFFQFVTKNNVSAIADFVINQNTRDGNINWTDAFDHVSMYAGIKVPWLESATLSSVYKPYRRVDLMSLYNTAEGIKQLHTRNMCMKGGFVLKKNNAGGYVEVSVSEQELLALSEAATLIRNNKPASYEVIEVPCNGQGSYPKNLRADVIDMSDKGEDE